MAYQGYLNTITPTYKNVYNLNEQISILPINNFTTLKIPTDKYPGGYDMEYYIKNIEITSPTNVKTQLNGNGDTFQFLQSGVYTLHYYGTNRFFVNDIVTGGKVPKPENYSFTFQISAVENKLPLKPWSITDVINRLFDLCEPLRFGELPRFKLNEEQAVLFDKIRAPQFSLTRQTLRECLQEVGKVIHGEPRLKIKKGPLGYEYQEIKLQNFTNGEVFINSNSPAPYEEGNTYYIRLNNLYYHPVTVESRIDETASANDDYYLVLKDNTELNGSFMVYEQVPGKEEYYYEVIYDLYASQEGSDIFYKPYISKGAEWTINNYQTWVDSNAENLVNQLDKLGGVIVEPYSNGAKSVRTENQYVRIEEGNMLIATQYPIYTVEKLEYVYEDGGKVKAVDLTPYIFEKSEYDTRLSSYREQYPYSKAYGLYFSQGSKNIGGLNFKVEAASFAAFKNYAITNILKQVIGSGYSLPAYPLLAFRVTYTPYYNVRVAQTKTNYKDFKFPAALIYNQQSNVIEGRYYGENLKGVTARLGNVEKSFMYCFKTLKKVPKAGQLFGNDYYISAVATEILPNYIRCTVGLSKDFNRISAYIGVPSEKRYYEISQSQAVDRNVLLREYIVVGDRETADEDAICFNMMSYVSNTFNGSNSAYEMITHVVAKGVSYKGNDLSVVDLPVISSAFGNSVSFAWRYEDNYSAGAISHKVDNSLSGNITGYWQNDARYTDYYGRVYYYYFSLYASGEQYIEQNSLDLPQTVPTEKYSRITNVGKEPMILRKDNREALQINFQIDFVTNTDIIIGSALASYFTAVRNGRNKYLAAVLYVFPTELNKFTDHVEGWEDVDLSKMDAVAADAYTFVGGCLVKSHTNKFPASGKSWAIIIRQLEGETELVEDEKGNQYEYKETYGGDLLIGRNQEVTAGQEFTPIYFTPKREIFDKSVWVDIK